MAIDLVKRPVLTHFNQKLLKLDEATISEKVRIA